MQNSCTSSLESQRNGVVRGRRSERHTISFGPFLEAWRGDQDKSGLHQLGKGSLGQIPRHAETRSPGARLESKRAWPKLVERRKGLPRQGNPGLSRGIKPGLSWLRGVCARGTTAYAGPPPLPRGCGQPRLRLRPRPQTTPPAEAAGGPAEAGDSA